MSKKDRYRVSVDRSLKLTGGMVDLLRRRTVPFLEGGGIERPITTLLQEVYLQGLTDAVDVLEHRDTGRVTPPTEP